MTSLDMEALVTSLDMFVHQENLALFKKRLADPETTDAERELLLKLLAEEGRSGRGGSQAYSEQGSPVLNIPDR
jgi:hypothetical protein